MSERSERPISLRHRVEFSLLLVAAFLFRRLPLSLTRRMAEAMGKLAAAMGVRRKVALNNLRQAFPDKGEAELKRLFSDCMAHFVTVAAEQARLPRLTRRKIERWIDVGAAAMLNPLLDQGKGVIIVSGHIGNWEWMGGALSIYGYPISYVVTTQSNPLVERWLDDNRRAAGVEIIARKDAVKGVLKALRRNRIVCILCDQDAGRAGVFTEFFGRPASTPRGAALFHLKSGAPLVFSAATRKADGRFRVVFERLAVSGFSGDRDAEEQVIMDAISRRLEQEVRRSPEQWLWLHRRWKTEPELD